LTRRVLVAMSGGVDSAVTAALLSKQGDDVTGLSLKLHPGESETSARAAAIADKLRIPHQVLDLQAAFSSQIIEPFCREYALGRTPNPCVRCNRLIKFGALLEFARQEGYDYLATGHYARAEPAPSGFQLLRGTDKTKDQSYFLYLLGQTELKSVLFPLGAHQKTKIKRIATTMGISSFTGKESQDICFLPEGGYAPLIAARCKLEPGDIIDIRGRTLGRHSGLAYYTVGQRQGLRIASAEPLYVLKLDTQRNSIIVGTREELFHQDVAAGELSWVAGQAPINWEGVKAKVRYRSPEVAVTVKILDNVARIGFATPQWGIAPGQSIVFFRDEEVLGGGIIQEGL
jgi:tRNA-uridine 2-sulfurtransferase